MTARYAQALRPVLIGHVFQQTALGGMLPVLSLSMGLPPDKIGVAVGAGLVTTALSAPFLARTTGKASLNAAVFGLGLSSFALGSLILAPPAIPAMTFVAFMTIRIVQGVSAALVLAAAQAATATGSAKTHALARLQFYPAIGRMLGAGLIGPLVRLSLVAPLIPAAAGAMFSLWMLRSVPATIPAGPGQGATRPWLRALPLPFLVQLALGSAQIGLGPLFTGGFDMTAAQASGAAGICLACAYLGVAVAQRWITTLPISTTPFPIILCLTGAAIPFAGNLAAVAILATLLAAATAVMTTRNLAAAMSAAPMGARTIAVWNATAQLAGLGLGMAAGAQLLQFSLTAPYLLSAVIGFALLFRPNTQRTRS